MSHPRACAAPRTGKTALACAVEKGKLKWVQELLDAGAVISFPHFPPKAVTEPKLSRTGWA